MLTSSSRIPGNAYILVFLGVLSTKIPGNSGKRWPHVFVKTKKFDRNFPGKILNFISRMSRNPYILVFLHNLLTQIPGNFCRDVTNFGVFWRNSWISKNSKFPGNHNFFLRLLFCEIWHPTFRYEFYYSLNRLMSVQKTHTTNNRRVPTPFNKNGVLRSHFSENLEVPWI